MAPGGTQLFDNVFMFGDAVEKETEKQLKKLNEYERNGKAIKETNTYLTAQEDIFTVRDRVIIRVSCLI